MKRASKSAKGGGVGEEGVGEGGSNKVSGVSRDVATLVVSCDEERR